LVIADGDSPVAPAAAWPLGEDFLALATRRAPTALDIGTSLDRAAAAPGLKVLADGGLCGWAANRGFARAVRSIRH
jgi:hypothetical protein